MDKKYIAIISACALCAVLVIAVITYALTKDNTNNTGIANPSATYCVEQGYTYEIRDGENGQSGYCIFSDNSECEGWAYYYGNCTLETASACKNVCGDGECQAMVCQAIGCDCAETAESCSFDCSE